MKQAHQVAGDLDLDELENRWSASDVQGDSSLAAVEPSLEWPEPLPIQSDLPPVLPLHEELLPVSFRALVRDVTERMQVPIDYPAAVIVLCLAGAVNRRAVMQPKANDSSWVIVPNL